MFGKELKISQADIIGKMLQVACWLTHYMPPVITDSA
jgi:hypothetical protein